MQGQNASVDSTDLSQKMILGKTSLQKEAQSVLTRGIGFQQKQHPLVVLDYKNSKRVFK